MKVYKATIVRRIGHLDHVYIKTDLPEADRHMVGYLDLEFKASYGISEEYLKKHFPEIEQIEVIDVDRLRGTS